MGPSIHYAMKVSLEMPIPSFLRNMLCLQATLLWCIQGVTSPGMVENMVTLGIYTHTSAEA